MSKSGTSDEIVAAQAVNLPGSVRYYANGADPDLKQPAPATRGYRDSSAGTSPGPVGTEGNQPQAGHAAAVARQRLAKIIGGRPPEAVC